MSSLKDTDFAFLTSVRFWKLVLIGVLQALVAVGVIGGELGQQIIRILQLVLGGDITVRTIDRFAEKAGSSDTGN